VDVVVQAEGSLIPIEAKLSARGLLTGGGLAGV
jgi:hypothetical protein